MTRPLALLRPLLGAAIAAWLALPAMATTTAYASAQNGFQNRIIGTYGASHSSDQTSAQAGIGSVQISGDIVGSDGATRDKAPTYAYSATDYTVVGLQPDTALTFTWLITSAFEFTTGEASWGWSSLVGVNARRPNGVPAPGSGSYSMYGNLVVQNFQGSIGDPDPIIACNGGTRGQAFCLQRRDSGDFINGVELSVTVLAQTGSTGFVEQSLQGDGWSVDFGTAARLLSVSVTDAVFFSGGSPAPQSLSAFSAVSNVDEDGFLASALSLNGTAPQAYIEWADGSRMDITVSAHSAGTPLPAPTSVALAALGLGLLWRRRRPAAT